MSTGEGAWLVSEESEGSRSARSPAGVGIRRGVGAAGPGGEELQARQYGVKTR